MIKWLEEFFKDCEKVNKIKEIEHEKKFHEIVVGMVPVDLQKFKTVFSKRVNNLDNAVMNHLEKHDDPNYDGGECSEFHRFVDFEAKKLTILNDIFWTELKERIGYRVKEGYEIGVRSHWTVVEYNEEEGDGWDEIEEIFDNFEKIIKILSFRPGSQN